MSLPFLYKENETNFDNMGLGPLGDNLSCLVTEERNGIFVLEMKYPIDGPLINELKNQRIIKADAGHNLKGQRFVIGKVTKPLDGIVTVFAEHYSYITQQLPLQPEVHIFKQDGAGAIELWRRSIKAKNDLEVFSDIPTEGSTDWSIKTHETPRQALGGVRGSLLDVWGGEYKFDNNKISLLKQRGRRANALIAYGRNLTDFRQEENITNTVTSITPFATYTEEGARKEKMVTLPEIVVHSEHVEKYANVRTIPIDFSDKFKDNEIPNQNRLRSLAESYIKANNVGVPNVSIKLSYIDLAKTIDYQDAPHEEINLCDELTVKFSKLNISTSAKVIRVVWNVNLERYDSVELGDARGSSFSKIIKELEDTSNSNIEKAFNEAQKAANEKNKVYRGPDEPSGENLNEGDLWYKPDGDETILYIWNGENWEEEMSTAPNPKIVEEIEKHEKELEKHKQEIEDAVNKADNSKEIADEAKEIAADINSQLPKIKENALSALEKFNDLSTRNLFKGYPGNEELVAEVKDGYYYQIKFVSTNRLIQLKPSTKYTFNWSASILSNSSSTTPRVNLGYSNGISDYVLDGLATARITDTTVTFTTPEVLPHKYLGVRLSRTSGIHTSQIAYTDLSLYEGEYTKWSPAPDDIQTQISNIDGELSQKVSQISFDELDKKVIEQATQISQNKDDITLKANKSEVNTLTGRVESAEGKLIVQDASINSLVSKTDGHTTEIGKLNLTAQGLSSTVSKIETDFDNLSIGATNYFGLTTDIRRKSYVSVVERDQKKAPNGFLFSGFGDGPRGLRIPKTVTGNGWWTVSGWFRGTESTEISFAIDINDLSPQVFVSGGDNEWTFFEYTVNVTNYTESLYNFVDIDGIEAKEYLIKDFKIEKGTKATDWSLAPQDIATQVQFASIEQTVDKIQTTVMDKADKSQITQLSDMINLRVTKKEYEQDLWLTGDFVDGGYGQVWPIFYKNKYLENPDVTTFREIHFPSNLRMFDYNYPPYGDKFKVVTFYDSVNGKVTQKAKYLGESADEIERIGDPNTNSSGGNKGDWGSWKRTTNEHNAISQINISPEKILIESKLIHLSGKSLIDDAVITNAMIHSLSADKINAGSINAANINIINMNASNIVTGYLNSNVIQAKSITGDKLSANAVQIGFNNLGNVLYLSPTSLNLFDGSSLVMDLTRGGLGFYNTNSAFLGGFTRTSIEGKPYVQGIRMNLTHLGDYVTWSYKETSNSTTYEQWLTLDTSGRATGRAGVNVLKHLHVRDGFTVSNGGVANFYRDIYMNGYGVKGTSLHSKKENFEYMEPQESLNYILETDFVGYNFKENPNAFNVGFVIDDNGESPYHTDEHLIRSGKYRDDSLLVGHSLLAIQALNEKIEQLERKIEKIKGVA